MGEVWWAKDRSTGADVAIKRIHVGRDGANHRAVLRFQREFHTLASLRHPRILRAYDYGVDERGPYYTMELLGGRDLGDILREEAPLSVEETCRHLRDIASGLAALHARGLVHRDLSPHNVRIVEGRAVLFDLGVLMSAGVVVDVAGTPAYLAPEMFRGVPVDGRADLYALGVLAYAMVTGRKPYEARSLEELAHVWQQPPAPPSAIAAVPEALEDLILDLLSHEPLARPPSAAALIDRLTAIGGLEADPGIVVTPGFLGSASLVGRDEPLAILERAFEGAASGGVARFAIEAESGGGKTRLLTEAALRARLLGVTPLMASGERADGRPYGLLAQLVDAAFAALPEGARDASLPDARWLGRLFAPIRAAHRVRDEADGAEPAEDRLRQQVAAAGFFRRLAARHPIALLVDDVQLADEASGAALLTLGTGTGGAHGLTVGFARRLGEAFRAPDLREPFERIETRVRLRGLEVAGVEALARSVFGEVPNLSRLARALQDSTGGSPLLCIEALRGLIDSSRIRYTEGSWIIPSEIRASDVPGELSDALGQRLERLSPLARSLAELLAVHGGQASLERILALAADQDPSVEPSAVFGALTELGRQGLIVEREAGLGYANEAFRQAVLARLDEARSRSIHRVVGEVLARDPTAAEVRTGWHLVRGGAARRGAPMLERAGRALYEAHALADCIEPLRMALEARTEAGAPAAVLADLEYMLLNAGWVSDRAVAAAHGERAAALLGDLAGIDTMHWLGPWVGWRLAFFGATAWAGLRWLFRFGEARGPTPFQALSHFVLALTYATAVAYAGHHKGDVRRLIDRMRPFQAFRGQPPYAGLQTVRAMLDVLDGRLVAAADRLEEASGLATRSWLNPLSAMERRVADAGIKSVRITVDVNQFHPRLRDDIAAIDRIGLAYYQHCARSIEAVHHRYRGEEVIAQELERALEATEVQLGAWSTELQRLLFAHPAYAICHDVEGLKRSLDGLERRVDEGMDLQERVVMTRAEILRERGRPEEALTLVEPLLEQLAPDDHLFRQYAGSTAAQSALEMGRWQLAADHARAVLADAADPTVRVLLPWLRAQRVLGLAEEALGDGEAGARRVEEAIALAESVDCPVLAGELHEARARIALAAGDREAFAHHRSRCEAWLRPTGNPGLIAVVERLFELDREADADAVDVRRRRPGASGELSLTALTPVGGDLHAMATALGGASSPSVEQTASVTRGVTRESSTVPGEVPVPAAPDRGSLP